MQTATLHPLADTHHTASGPPRLATDRPVVSGRSPGASGPTATAARRCGIGRVAGIGLDKTDRLVMMLATRSQCARPSLFGGRLAP